MRHTYAILFIALLASASVKAEDAKAAQEKKRCEKANLNYLLYLPSGYDKSKEAYPLILFLHGAGERGENLALVKKHGPPKIVEKKRDFPFIVVSPQAQRFGWDPKALLTLLDEVSANVRVDKDRIYLTGLSMGGYGTWTLAAAAPDRFAAIVPICGGGARSADARREQAGKLEKMPIWVFHGAKDRAVPLARSEEMMEALKKAGNKTAKITVYPDAEHDSWTVTYDNPELYKWLLSHKRKGSR